MFHGDRDLKIAIHHYKNGHTLSLDEHNQATAATVGPRSKLLKRANSMPKMPNDTSYELVQEEINRKLLHSTILSKNPAAFRRTAPETSCAKFASQKHSVRDLLPTIHPVSDPNDISPPKFGYNFTKRPKETQELQTHLEDFLQPQSQVIPRQTGYSKGHIRTVLELDTFGPNHSDAVSESRSQGNLPLSPNVDRNVTSPHGSRCGTPFGGSRCSTPYGGSRCDSPPDMSGVVSRTGSKDDEGRGRRGPKSTLTGTVKVDLGKSSSAHLIGTTDLYHAMKTAGKAEVVEITLPRPSTAGFVEDARGNSLMWTKRREEMLKEKKEQKERYRKFQKDMHRQQNEAEEVASMIDTFEMNLKSTKSYL